MEGVNGGMLPLLALHAATEFYRAERKPRVTATLIIANSLVYLRPGILHRLLPTIEQVAFNPHLILKYGDWKRLLLSAFYHAGEQHLVYNMMSLLWKGIHLETSMGSSEFAAMVASLLAMSQSITLLLSKTLLQFFGCDAPYYDQYVVGFSGVLFGLKVVINSQLDDVTYIHGMAIPTRYAAWAELVLIQMFVPGVSFLGHLGGVLAGIAYLRLRKTFSGPDPLLVLLKNVNGVIRWPLRFVRKLFRCSLPWISVSAGRSVGGGRPRSTSLSGVWSCPACTFDNDPFVDVCEMCSTGRRGPDDPPNDLSFEELRMPRLERLSR